MANYLVAIVEATVEVEIQAIVRVGMDEIDTFAN